MPTRADIAIAPENTTDFIIASLRERRCRRARTLVAAASPLADQAYGMSVPSGLYFRHMPASPDRATGLLVAAGLAGLLAVAAPAMLRGASAVPVPTVTGPVAATAAGDPGHDYPFY